MNKIAIAMAVSAFAIVANAASVKWNTGTYSNGFADPDGKSLANSTLYTATVYIYSDAAGNTLLDTTSSTKAVASGAFTGTSGDVLAFNTTYYLKAIVTLNSDPSVKIETDGLVSFTTPGTGTPTLNLYTGANFTNSGSQWSASGWSSVPEPTSGLLLLLGMAGLALKRKQA